MEDGDSDKKKNKAEGVRKIKTKNTTYSTKKEEGRAGR